MKKLLKLSLTLIFFQSIYIQAQEINDSIIYSKVFLKSGEIYMGKVMNYSNNETSINDWNIGLITIKNKSIKKTEEFRKNDLITINLTDGSVYNRKLIQINAQNIEIADTNNKIIGIPRFMIQNIEHKALDRYSTQNPNSTRYFFAPSAIPLKKGEGYYQNAYLLANSVNYGFSRNFTLGGGVIIPILFYATPKFGFQVAEKICVGGGAIVATTIIPNAIISGGIPFGVFTFGNSETNITLGTGYGLLWDESSFESTNYPITTLNGMVRLSNSIQLVVENWIIPISIQHEEYGYVNDDDDIWIPYDRVKTYKTKELIMALSAGMRILIGKNMTVDFAPIYLRTPDTNGLVVPYLDFVYKF